MIEYGASGIWSAWWWVTWIGARVIQTALSWCTVFVWTARINAAIVQTNVSQEAIVIHATSYWKFKQWKKYWMELISLDLCLSKRYFSIKSDKNSFQSSKWKAERGKILTHTVVSNTFFIQSAHLIRFTAWQTHWVSAWASVNTVQIRSTWNWN